MQLQVVSKGIDVSPALRARVEDRMSAALEKYFNHQAEAHVAVSREGDSFRADATLHLQSGAILRAEGKAGDGYGAVDDVMTHLEKRLRRYKRKLTDRRQNTSSQEAALLILQASASTDLDDDDEASVNGSDPVVIAEGVAELPVLTVGMAVHEMDVTDAPTIMFRNAAHGGLNVIYRRPDGHIGWLDPERALNKAS